MLKEMFYSNAGCSIPKQNVFKENISLHEKGASHLCHPGRVQPPKMSLLTAASCGLVLSQRPRLLLLSQAGDMLVAQLDKNTGYLLSLS